MKVAVVIPSMRGPKCLESFIDISPDNVDFIVLSQEKLEKTYERTIEFNDKEIFSKSWIFNRYSKRNFGFLYAYKQNYDVIINLDDDCFPTSNTFFEKHINTLKSTVDNHFNILNAFSDIPKEIFEKGARGYSTEIEKKFQVVINQGLWIGDLDLPAKTIWKLLKSNDGKIPPPLSTKTSITNHFTIPDGQLTTVCGMNISFLREVIPAFPYTYMEAEGYGIARYDDIWSGLFIKIILDKLEKRMSAGFPVIKHEKGKRDIQKDIEYEDKGEKMNNFLWENLPKLQLEGNDYTTCFLEIADWLSQVSDVPERFFFKKISESMFEWINLIDGKDTV